MSFNLTRTSRLSCTLLSSKAKLLAEKCKLQKLIWTMEIVLQLIKVEERIKELDILQGKPSKLSKASFSQVMAQRDWMQRIVKSKL